MTVINPIQVDMWFGAGTAARVWETTKRLGGYVVILFLPSKYRRNTTLQMALLLDLASLKILRIKCSPENGPLVQLTCFAFSPISSLVCSPYCLKTNSSSAQRDKWLQEETLMLNTVLSELTTTVTINGLQCENVAYANKRYWIPFGWWVCFTFVRS